MAKNRQALSGMNSLLKGILYFIGGLLILLLLLQVVISLFADDYVADTLRKQVRTSSDSTYALSFEDLDLNVYSGSATINNVRIQADTAAFSSLSSSPFKNSPGILFQGELGKVDISGVDLLSSVLGDELHISSIDLVRPDLTALKNPRHDAAATKGGGFSSIDSTIFAAISGQYKAVEIDEFTIQEGYGFFTRSGDTLSSLGPLDLKLRDIRIDSASAQSGRTFITDNISLEAQKFRMKLPDSLNIIAFDQLSVSSGNQAVAVDSLRLIPRYGKMEFARRNGSPIDRIDLTMPKVEFNGVDFSRFVDSARLYVRYGNISNAELNDYYNRSIAGGPPTYVSLPMSMFKKMEPLIKIDSLRVEDSYISYAEYVGGTPRAGIVTFERLSAIFRNISNYPGDIKKGFTTTLDAQARVMGNALLDAHFKFPMNTKNDFHEIEGQLHRMPMADFNRMLEYVAFIRMDQGVLNSLEFKMTLDDDRASGSVIMNYEDLKISVLDKQSIQQRGLLENMTTFLANNFIVREHNTPEAGMQAGRIEFDRDKSKSIFNFWWKSLLSGIKDSIKK